MRFAALAAGAGVLLAVLSGCAGADYFRPPQPGGAEGSTANEVGYAFFSMVKPRFGLPLAYTEFNPDVDEDVVFFAWVGQLRRPFSVRGTLSRPDGAAHASFTRSPDPRYKGPTWAISVVETFPMASLRPHQGRWRLELFLDDVSIGTYPFLLADKAHIAEFRRAR